MGSGISQAGFEFHPGTPNSWPPWTGCPAPVSLSFLTYKMAPTLFKLLDFESMSDIKPVWCPPIGGLRLEPVLSFWPLHLRLYAGLAGEPSLDSYPALSHLTICGRLGELDKVISEDTGAAGYGMALIRALHPPAPGRQLFGRTVLWSVRGLHHLRSSSPPCPNVSDWPSRAPRELEHVWKGNQVSILPLAVFQKNTGLFLLQSFPF